MASYYYLLSSLPMLTADSGMPFDYQTFLGLCQNNVGDDTYRQLSELSLKDCGGPIGEEWNKFYTTLMRELNLQRSSRLGWQYKTTFDRDASAAAVAALALNADHPLEGEKLLLDYEFTQIDTIVGLHDFDEESLFGYALKLKLLERISCFEQEAGRQEFSDLTANLQGQLMKL